MARNIAANVIFFVVSFILFIPSFLYLYFLPELPNKTLTSLGLTFQNKSQSLSFSVFDRHGMDSGNCSVHNLRNLSPFSPNGNNGPLPERLQPKPNRNIYLLIQYPAPSGKADNDCSTRRPLPRHGVQKSPG